jgi:hypothetical protein
MESSRPKGMTILAGLDIRNGDDQTELLYRFAIYRSSHCSATLFALYSNVKSKGRDPIDAVRVRV